VSTVKWGKDEAGWTQWNDGSLGWTLGAGARLYPSGDGWGRIGFDAPGATSWACSPVVDTGVASNFISVTDTPNGAGYAVQIRGQLTSFGATDGTPTWEDYSVQVQRAWRYIQVRVTYFA
jgi:hypothetical protein